MATAQGDVAPDVVALGTLPAPALRELLDHERRAWRSRLFWDMRDSVDMAARAIASGVLDGAALRRGSRSEGFLTFQPSRSLTRLCGGWLGRGVTHDAAALLVEATLARVPVGSRLEGQVAAFDGQDALDAGFDARGCTLEPRDYLVAEPPSCAETPPDGIGLVRVGSSHVASCARVLLDAHRFGVESRINAAFRTSRSAHEYLSDILAGQGCGDPQADACVVALQGTSVVGFCLATTISDATGHVPQIAVSPSHQGRGVGGAMLAAAWRALAKAGARRMTLSVSRSNERAAAWYRRAGFWSATRFTAFVRDSD